MAVYRRRSERRMGLVARVPKSGLETNFFKTWSASRKSLLGTTIINYILIDRQINFILHHSRDCGRSDRSRCSRSGSTPQLRSAAVWSSVGVYAVSSREEQAKKRNCSKDVPLVLPAHSGFEVITIKGVDGPRSTSADAGSLKKIWPTDRDR